MQDQFNPYAAPTTSTMHPRAAEWLQSTNDPSLQKVATGLGLIYTSILIMLLLFLFLLFGALIGPVVLTVFLIGIVIASIINLIGSFMCLATPEETGAKGLITTSVVLVVVSLILTLVNLQAENQGIAALANILSLIGFIAFVLFLKKLSEFIGAMHLAQRARTILVALGVGVVLVILMFAMTFAAARAGIHGGGAAGFGIVAVLGLILGIGGIVVFVMYANLINNLRKAIQSGGAVYF